MLPDRQVLIIGGGFSGTLLAINLLRFGGPRAMLVDRHADQLARGVAYSADQRSQLLNVRAGGMSAFPDVPDHFVRWLATHGGGDAASFVPRATYGAYLRETLAAEHAGHEDRLTLAVGDVADLRSDADGVQASLADGTTIRADAAVLAVGNLPPHTPGGIDPAALPPGSYCDDPWRAELGAGLGPDDTVVLLGTGLTAIDVALRLDDAAFAGRIVAMSRRGLAPRRHDPAQPPVTPLRNRPGVPLSALVRDTRTAAATDWRCAVDALRPVTQRLWGGWDPATRARFLRHLRPYWDVHRHRLAPAVADRIDAMVARGQLIFTAGKLVASEADGARALLRWRPRHAAAPVATRAARVVNCTGPQGDLTRTDDALLCTLWRRGTIRPDPLRLGIDVTAQGRIVGRNGIANPAVSCIGPMTRGGLWEVVAVPDLRRQVWDVARRLANAQWVGGEGL